MNQLETGEASEATHGNSDSQKELAEVLRQRAAISAVLRAIASSPHDLQPIFDTIISSAVHLCRAEEGSFRIVEEAGLGLVAHKRSPRLSEWHPRPKIHEHGSFIGRLWGSKSPVHIPDLPTHLERNSAGEAAREYVSKTGNRTILIVPMLRNDELIGSLGLGRRRIEPFTENEIELLMDFAAQTAIVLEITCRERQHRQMAMELAHANRIATIGQLTASIAHEIKQPLAAIAASGDAGLRWLSREAPDIEKAKQSIARTTKDAHRAVDIMDRLHGLAKKQGPQKECCDPRGDRPDGGRSGQDRSHNSLPTCL
jgi:GAF domain-containing protein